MKGTLFPHRKDVKIKLAISFLLLFIHRVIVASCEGDWRTGQSNEKVQVGRDTLLYSALVCILHSLTRWGLALAHLTDANTQKLTYWCLLQLTGIIVSRGQK